MPGQPLRLYQGVKYRKVSILMHRNKSMSTYVQTKYESPLFSFQNIPIPINENNSSHQICVCLPNQTESIAVIILSQHLLSYLSYCTECKAVAFHENNKSLIGRPAVL